MVQNLGVSTELWVVDQESKIHSKTKIPLKVCTWNDVLGFLRKSSRAKSPKNHLTSKDFGPFLREIFKGKNPQKFFVLIRFLAVWQGNPSEMRGLLKMEISDEPDWGSSEISSWSLKTPKRKTLLSLTSSLGSPSNMWIFPMNLTEVPQKWCVAVTIPFLMESRFWTRNFRAILQIKVDFSEQFRWLVFELEISEQSHWISFGIWIFRAILMLNLDWDFSPMTLYPWSLTGPIQNMTSQIQKIFMEKCPQTRIYTTRGWDPTTFGLNMNECPYEWQKDMYYIFWVYIYIYILYICTCMYLWCRIFMIFTNCKYRCYNSLTSCMCYWSFSVM